MKQPGKGTQSANQQIAKANWDGHGCFHHQQPDRSGAWDGDHRCIRHLGRTGLFQRSPTESPSCSLIWSQAGRWAQLLFRVLPIPDQKKIGLVRGDWHLA